jgi:tetratricopeptide (TPR) repeat protein
VQSLQEQADQADSLQRERDAAKRELLSVQTELNALKSNRESSGKASTSLKEAMDRLTQENRDLQSKVNSLSQQQTNGNNQQLRQLQSQVASLTEKYNQANQETNKAKQELLAYQRTHSTSSGEIGNGKANAGLQQQVAELNRQLADARKENASLRDSLGSKTSRSSTASNPEAEQDYQEGKAALASKDTAKAIDKLKEAQLLEPDNGDYVTDYSSALAEDHQYAEAIDVLRRYLQRHPADREAYNQLGKLYLLNDEAEAANQAFTRALSVSTLNNYATSLKKLGRMGDAEQVFKLALTMNPKDSEVLFNLGNLYNAENKLELARNKYLEALQIKPDFAEAHYNLGLIFSKLGDNAKAVTHLEKFLELSPNARNADTIRTYVQKLKA